MCLKTRIWTPAAPDFFERAWTYWIFWPLITNTYCLLKRCKLKKHWFSHPSRQSVNTKEKALKCKCVSRNWFASFLKRGQWMGSSVFYEASSNDDHQHGITVISSFEYRIALKKNLHSLESNAKKVMISIEAPTRVWLEFWYFSFTLLHQTLVTVLLTFIETEITIFPPDIVF